MEVTRPTHSLAKVRKWQRQYARSSHLHDCEAPKCGRVFRCDTGSARACSRRFCFLHDAEGKAAEAEHKADRKADR